MSTSWDEASQCPGDGTPGRVVNRRAVPRDQGGGQMVTLECNLTRCEYHEQGWIVQIRPDNTIPDPTPKEQREKNYAPTALSHARKRAVLDALEEQFAQEQRPGTEVKSPYR
jgi:hypothetical protein